MFNLYSKTVPLDLIANVNIQKEILCNNTSDVATLAERNGYELREWLIINFSFSLLVILPTMRVKITELSIIATGFELST